MKKLLVVMSVLTCVCLAPISSARAAHPGQVAFRVYCNVCGGAAYKQWNPHCGWVPLPHYCPPGTCSFEHGVHYKCAHTQGPSKHVHRKKHSHKKRHHCR